MAEFLGPALPPGYKKQTTGEERDLIGPELPGGRGQQQQGRRTHNEKSAVSIGPELPPDFKASSSKSETPDDCIGPQLPPDVQAPSSSSPSTFGPTLPPHLRTSSTAIHKEETTNTTLGPCLPPTIVKSSDKDTAGSGEEASYGPSLPPDLASVSPKVIGPTLPPGLGEKPDEQPWVRVRDPTPPSSEEEEDFIGPLPVAAEREGSIELQRKRLEIEARSREMRNRLENKGRPAEPQQPKREEWMTELPPEIKPLAPSLGLSARKFRTGTSNPGDRSVWTDTPADRLRKAQEVQQGKVKKAPVRGGEVEYASVSSRDKKLASQVEEYNKQHRSQSLLDMHRKRRAEERSGEEEERRPFNRETDLGLPRNLVTSAKRRALVKDSVKALGSKFTHGKRSFL